MNDKDRLEQIKDNSIYLDSVDSYFNAVACIKEDYEWLIKQAERVEELEQKIRVDNELFEKQVQQNQRYRGAVNKIKDYADICISAEVEMSPYLVMDDIDELEDEK